MSSSRDRVISRQLIDRAYECVAAQEFDEANQLIDRALQHNPSNIDGYLCRAQIFESQNDYDGAIRECTKAIEIDPQSWVAYNNRAFSLRKRDPAQALLDYNQAIEINSQKFEPFFQRAEVHLALKQFEECVEDASNALKIDPDGYCARVYRAFANAGLKAWALALDDFEFLLAHRASPVFLFHRSICLTELGRYEEALQDAQRFEDEFGGANGASEYCRAAVQHARGELDVALANLNIACAKLSEFRPAFEKRAAVQRDLGATRQAEEDSRIASTLEIEFFSVSLDGLDRDFIYRF